MDKRTLIFVFGLVVIFFLLHQWMDFGGQTAPSVALTNNPSSPKEQEMSTTENDKELSTSKIPVGQELYVLENEYQQLVFSTINGALVEINLPFYSEQNPSSVVREIRFDKILLEKYPKNEYFPQFPYRISDGKGGITPMMNPTLGGYYPLLRRNILSSEYLSSIAIPPHYYALSAETEDVAKEGTLYQLKRLEKNLIEFESTSQNRKITKTFSFPQDINLAPYCIELKIKVEGDARGLFLSSGVPEVEIISDNFTPTLKYRIFRNQKPTVEVIKPPKTTTEFSHVRPDWICNGNGFFGIILDPMGEGVGSGFGVHAVPGEITPTRLSLIDASYERFPLTKYPGYGMHFPLSTKPGTSQFRIYAGPFDKQILQRVDETFTSSATGMGPDYLSCQHYHGWFAFISQPFAKFLFVLLNFFYKLTHSWGISIIFLTVALRLMLYPLNSWSIKSTLKMQEIAPKITAIQEKYKKDPKKAQLEVMNLYRQGGVNPFGGCLPMIIQLPFLFGMFDLLKSSFDLRGVSFIPGWIDNLTAPDVVFSWDYPILFFGNSFHLLPILLGAIMYIQQKYASAAKATLPLTDAQKQQRLMGNMMTIVFSVLFYHFPSGLNIYWISSTLLGILQQWWLNKKKSSSPAAPSKASVLTRK